MTQDELKQIYRKCLGCNQVTDWIETPRVIKGGREIIEGTCKTCGNQITLPRLIDPGEQVLQFGKHKDQKLGDVPLEYLKWGLEADAIGGGAAWAAIYLLTKAGIPFTNYRLRGEPTQKEKIQIEQAERNELHQ